MNQRKLIIEILNYLEKNIYKKITLKELSRMFYFNKDYIMRLFKREIGLTIFEYINSRKIYLSLLSYKNAKYSILKIAINHGFDSQEYYSEIFKKIMGVNPYSYKKFMKVTNELSYETIYEITDNLVKLKLLMNRVEEYKNSIPQETVKKISINKKRISK